MIEGKQSELFYLISKSSIQVLCQKLRIKKMKIVEIFKTDVFRDSDTEQICTSLSQTNPHYRINFDFEDEDNVLRIETNQFAVDISSVIGVMKDMGYACELIR